MFAKQQIFSCVFKIDYRRITKKNLEKIDTFSTEKLFWEINFFSIEICLDLYNIEIVAGQHSFKSFWKFYIQIAEHYFL